MQKSRDLSIESEQRDADRKVVAKKKSANQQLSDYIYHKGRQSKTETEKYKPISIRLHPVILEWAKAEAQKRGIGYQSVINETLLEQIVS
jgi:predicted DNA binding CopG/RHH family protein